jgi:Cupredoxin-like domain
MAATLATLGFSVKATASEPVVSELRVANGRFEPANLVVPAGTALQLKVINSGNAAVEFESFELHRERLVAPGASVTVYIPPLAPGSYPFFDDFHHETSQGAIISK